MYIAAIKKTKHCFKTIQVHSTTENLKNVITMIRELTDNSGKPHPFSSQLHTSDRIKLKVQMVIHLLIPKIEKNMHLFYLQ